MRRHHQRLKFPYLIYKICNLLLSYEKNVRNKFTNQQTAIRPAFPSGIVNRHSVTVIDKHENYRNSVKKY